MKQRISHLTMRSNPCGNETTHTHTHTLRANSTPSTARERLESSIHKQDLDPSSPASQFTHRCNIASRNRTKATSRILSQIQLQAPVPACPSSPQAASRTLPQLQLQAPCQPVHLLRGQPRQLQSPFQPAHPLRKQPREFFPRSSSRPRASLSILSAGRLENSFPDPAPGPVPACVRPLRSQPREFFPRSSSRPVPACVHPLRRQPREFFPRPSSRPVAACPSLPQADSRIPPQVKFQSQFLPVHPLRSPSQNYYPDLVLESSPACPSAPQPAFRIPSQSQFQSPT